MRLFPAVWWLTPEWGFYTEVTVLCFWAAGVGGSHIPGNKYYWSSGCTAAMGEKKKEKKRSVTIWCKTKHIQISTLLKGRRWCQCGICMLGMGSRQQRVRCSSSQQGQTVSLMRSTWNQAQPISYMCRAAVPAASCEHLARRQSKRGHKLAARLNWDATLEANV